ncbi:MAG TPA: hypothetical protein PKO06_22430, partial [Candidatus Ozemobacteraceae bacterium]|nr:hypothetical protein [Candidatus Ozemobacteraceae bacterium]
MRARSSAAYSALSALRHSDSEQSNRLTVSIAKHFTARRRGFLLMEILFAIGLLAILTVYVSGHAGQVGLEADRQKNDMHAVVTGNNMIEIMIATSSTPFDVVTNLLPAPGPDGKIEIAPDSPLWSGGTTTSTVQIVKDADKDNPSSFTVLINNSNSGTQASYWHVFVPDTALGGTFAANRPPIVLLAATTNLNLVLKGNGKVLSWGRNNFGQAGQGRTGTPAEYDPISSPGLVKGVHGLDSLRDIAFVCAAKNGYTSFAMKSDGTLFGWGKSGIRLFSYQTANQVDVEYPIQIKDHLDRP